MKTAKYMLAILAICALSGCAGMTRTQQTTLSGGAIGAAGGAALGAITGGNAAVGAAVGGAAGALGGYIIGENGR